MEITVNGKPFEVEEGATIRALIDKLGIDGPVAVERNEAVVPRAAHSTERLHSGDRLEIVHFVGGG